MSTMFDEMSATLNRAIDGKYFDGIKDELSMRLGIVTACYLERIADALEHLEQAARGDLGEDLDDGGDTGIEPDAPSEAEDAPEPIKRSGSDILVERFAPNKLTPRTWHMLQRAYDRGEISQLPDDLSDDEILALTGFGPKMLAEIRQALVEDDSP